MDKDGDKKMNNIAPNQQTLVRPFRNFKLKNHEFHLFQSFMYDTTGVHLGPAKANLVANRLSSRLRFYNFSTFEEYYDLAMSKKNEEERHLMIHLLTTHETKFFREDKHFNYLRNLLSDNKLKMPGFSVWSAGCSSGQEVYSIAMTLEAIMGYERSWEVLGTDISKETIKIGASGLYPEAQMENIPAEYRVKHCLLGKGKYQGFFLFDKMLRSRTRFMQHNLNQYLQDMGKFNAIFLRNVMIYFDDQVKRKLIERITSVLKPNGLLFIGCSETITRKIDNLKFIQPGIYQLTR